MVVGARVVGDVVVFLGGSVEVVESGGLPVLVGPPGALDGGATDVEPGPLPPVNVVEALVESRPLDFGRVLRLP